MLVLKELEWGDAGHFTLNRMEHPRTAVIRVMERPGEERPDNPDTPDV